MDLQIIINQNTKSANPSRANQTSQTLSISHHSIQSKWALAMLKYFRNSNRWQRLIRCIAFSMTPMVINWNETQRVVIRAMIDTTTPNKSTSTKSSIPKKDSEKLWCHGGTRVRVIIIRTLAINRTRLLYWEPRKRFLIQQTKSTTLRLLLMAATTTLAERAVNKKVSRLPTLKSQAKKLKWGTHQMAKSPSLPKKKKYNILKRAVISTLYKNRIYSIARIVKIVRFRPFSSTKTARMKTNKHQH